VKLYSFFRSSAAYRVRIALNVKGLEYDYVAKDLRAGTEDHRKSDYLALNPQGLVPALQDQGQVFSQSLAIIEYLDEAYPQTTRLLPQAAADRAVVRSIAGSIACDIHPLNNLRVLNYLKSQMGQSDEATNIWYRHWITEGFAAIEQRVESYSGDGRYCFGNTLTLADVCLVPQVYNARRFKTDLSSFPKLLTITEFLETLSAFQAARPEVQPDAK
jgi:maleylacetoacetate isomerase/maleylpyruvate isomerase